VEPTEPSEHVLEEARAEVKEVVHNAQVNGKRGKGLTFVTLAVFVGALFFGILTFRTYVTDRSDTALCMKIDRFIVIAEQRTEASPSLTQEQKDAAIKAYEDFRNDPPVCRTTK
jgi:hypothetical protein